MMKDINDLKNEEINTFEQEIGAMRIQILELNLYIQVLSEHADSNAFSTGMMHFERKMQKTKEQWEEKKKGMEKQIIDWE